MAQERKDGSDADKQAELKRREKERLAKEQGKPFHGKGVVKKG